MNEWISVEDRLPELDTRVIVFTTNGWVVEMTYNSNKYARRNPKPRFEWHGSPGYSNTVTHWQPLPKPLEAKP